MFILLVLLFCMHNFLGSSTQGKSKPPVDELVGLVYLR